MGFLAALSNLLDRRPQRSVFRSRMLAVPETMPTSQSLTVACSSVK